MAKDKGKYYRMLVVEHSYSNYAFIREIIPQSIKMDWADCGEKAISFFSSSSYDLVIVDIGLPDMLGMDIISHIRAANKDVPVLVTTGYVSVENEKTYLALGANEVFFKPFAWKLFRKSVLCYMGIEDRCKGKTYRMLVVEGSYGDYAHIRAMIPQSIKMDWADCGEKAINFFSSLSYDLIVVDIGLPDMSGIDIITHIRFINKDVPVLVTTGCVSIEYKKTCLALGANEVYLKPFASELFCNDVSNYMENRDSITENPLQNI